MSRTIVHTYVPGKGATETYAAAQPARASDGHYYHEETAYTVAHGASLVECTPEGLADALRSPATGPRVVLLHSKEFKA